MSLRNVALITCALAGLSPRMASAQATFEGSVFAGAGLFLSSLATDQPFCVGDECIRYDEVSMGNALAVGANVGVRMGQLSIEGGATLVPSQQEFTGGSITPSVDTNVILLTGSLLFHLPVENPFFDPFLAVGGGIKRYSPDQGDSTSDPTGSVGGGLLMKLSPAFGLRFELRDYISSFSPENGESSLQNDVVISAGLAFGGS